MTPELDLLRPALEMAMIVARQGESAPLRIEAPRPVRPFLRFSKLPPRALAAARLALDDDDFRRRVADRSDEEEVGRAGWLFLSRPDRWAEEFDALVQEAAAAADASADRSLRADLRALKRNLDAQQLRIDEQDRELRRLHQQLDAREQAIELHRDEVVAARAAADVAVAERARAVRELKEMERRLGERTSDLRRLTADRSSGGVPGDAGERGAEIAAVAGPSEPDVRWDLANEMFNELRSQWEALGATLDALEGIGMSEDTAGLPAGRSGPTVRQPDDSRSGGRPSRRGRRRPLRLGRGLVDGTTEAARWLLGRPGAVVVVDGYNVTMLAWPDLAVFDQRLALERAAANLQVQVGAQVVLVFDGDEDGGAAVRAAVGSPVRVRFTDRDTEADDEILEMVETMTAPVVVVVSNDRRVLDGARERGVNTVRSTDFVTLLR